MLFNADNSRELREKLGLDLGEGLALSGNGVIASPSHVLAGPSVFVDVCWGGCVFFEPPLTLHNVQIGSHVRISRGLTFFNEPPSNWLAASPLFPGRKMPGVVVRQGPPTIIGADTWIGPNVMVKNGITIGQGCFIASGATLTEDIPDYSVVRGSTITGQRLPTAIIERAQRLRWFEYNWQNVPLDWVHPEKALDEMERLLEAGQGQRFISWQYEESGQDQLVFRKISEQ